MDLNGIHLFYSCPEQGGERLPQTAHRGQGKRREHAFAKDLVCYILSECYNIPPKRLKFTKTKFGKPELAPGTSRLPIRFNLSHCQNFAACAVTLDRAVGLDAEDMNRRVNLAVADRFFTAREARMLKAVPDTMKKELFFDLWTLKEAFVKADGKGLAYGLDRFGFDWGGAKAHTEPKIRFRKGREEQGRNWRFFSFNLLSRFKLALAVESGAQKPLVVNVHECRPFEFIRFKGRVAPGNTQVAK